MRTKNAAAPQPRAKPAVRPITFICTACEIVEHRRTPRLPEGWATEEIGDDIYAYCPECAIDLPRRGLPRDQVQ
jgi:hypothetical protein